MIAEQDAQLPPDAHADVEYVQAGYRPLADEDRPLVERGVLPRATYVMPDGTPMVPVDHSALLQDAAGDPDAVHDRFRERFVAAGGEPGDVDESHASWLSGEFGACLRQTTPEAIVLKGALMTSITALVARPAPDAAEWRLALRGVVDALDAIERPFAQYDRIRFGPTSRDRLITATRERFPEVWG